VAQDQRVSAIGKSGRPSVEEPRGCPKVCESGFCAPIIGAFGAAGVLQEASAAAVMRIMSAGILLLLVMSAAGVPAEIGRLPVAHEAAQYHVQLDDEDQLKISVHVWGKVSAPGLYVVPRATDLVSLISYAGGPAPDADLSRVRIVRENGEPPRVMRVDVGKYMKTGEQELNPLLKPGDTVEIGPNKLHGLSRVVQFIAQTAVIVSTYYLLFER